MKRIRARTSRPGLFLLLLTVAMIGGGRGPKAPSAVASAAPIAAQGHAIQDAPGIPGARLAETAVRRTYEAIARKDQYKYVDSMDPAARPGENPSSALSVAIQLSALPADTLTSLSFEEMRYEATRSDSTWAEVRVRGRIRNAALATETPLDSIEVAHNVDGGWYTSLPELYAQSPAGEEYAARIQRLNREGCHLSLTALQ